VSGGWRQPGMGSDSAHAIATMNVRPTNNRWTSSNSLATLMSATLLRLEEGQWSSTGLNSCSARILSDA
jgi:hypothetical protein